MQTSPASVLCVGEETLHSMHDALALRNLNIQRSIAKRQKKKGRQKAGQGLTRWLRLEDEALTAQVEYQSLIPRPTVKSQSCGRLLKSQHADVDSTMGGQDRISQKFMANTANSTAKNPEQETLSQMNWTGQDQLERCPLASM